MTNCKICKRKVEKQYISNWCSRGSPSICKDLIECKKFLIERIREKPIDDETYKNNRSYFSYYYNLRFFDDWIKDYPAIRIIDKIQDNIQEEVKEKHIGKEILQYIDLI